MRAASVLGPRWIVVAESHSCEPGPDQVRVRLEGCGVCGSSLPTWQGRPWFRYPLTNGALGHEGWGRIDALGDGVTEWKVGERVALISEHAYAEYDVTSQDHVVRLPQELDRRLFPGEALGCVMNIFRRAGIESGQTVAVVGIGFLGAALVQLAARAGARVIAVSRRPFALEIARRSGAAITFGLGTPDEIAGAVRDLTGGRGAERVIEAAGLQETLDLSTRLTAEGGRLVIAGYHQEGPRTVDMQLWNWRGLDVINAHERDPQMVRQGIQDAVRSVIRGDLDPLPLLTHQLPLERLGDAFQLIESRPEGFLKAVVTL